MYSVHHLFMKLIKMGFTMFFRCHLSLFSLSSRWISFLKFCLLSAALAKSGPLDFPSEKSLLLFFAYEKGLGHMFRK